MNIHSIREQAQAPSILSAACLTALLLLWTSAAGLGGVPHAQATPPIAPSGLNTQVNLSATPPAGNVQYDITGGTRPGGASGTNLFHSFGDFNVPTNNIANFLNETALPTTNILGRVTGGSISNIFGTIQTTGFGNANLFLMNPVGFLFGPNATVNVGGMVAFTTADYLRLADGARFNTIPNPAADALLAASPVAAFGFLGSNPGAITVQGSQFTVSQGQSISLVGGNVMIQSGKLENGAAQPARLSAPNGKIQLASAASPGEILSSNLQLGTNVNDESFTSLGSITISQDARIDTAGAIGGTIAIRGGQLTITDGATVTTAASSGPSAPAGSVTINGTGVQMTGSDVVINGTNVSVTGSKVTAANLNGSGGTIRVTAGSTDHPGNVTVAQNALLDASGTSGGSTTIRGGQLTIADATLSADTGNTNGPLTAVDIKVIGDMSISETRGVPAITARATGAGEAGEVRISSANLNATSTADSLFALIDTHTSGSGKGGDVSIAATGNLTATGSSSNLMFFIDSGTTGLAEGAGGGVTITATTGNVQLVSSSINTGDFVATQTGQESSGSGGDVTIAADTFQQTNSAIASDSVGAGRAGGISISARDIQINNFSLIGQQGINGTGALVINAENFVMSNSGQIVQLTAFAPGGGVTITANTVELKNGSTVQSQSVGDGAAGDIRITALDHLTLSDDPYTLDDQSTGQATRPSGLFTNSLGDLGNLGNAGAIIVTTPQLVVTGGARIDTTTQTNGHGGDVTIIAENSISISGDRPTPVLEIDFFGLGSSRPSGIFTRTVGTAPDAGAGGNIHLTAGQSVTISDGASVSAGSTGPGNAGKIFIDAGQQFEMRDSSITTTATKASGGNIDIQAVDRVLLVNSPISTTVRSGAGGGGNITIDPNVVVLLNSPITAQADRGAGGNITITTPLFLADSSSLLSASSERGVNGTVTIQSPNAPISGHIQPLDKSPLIAASLLNQRCASLANGEFSSFTVAGRDSLPTEPGSWLASPLATLDAGMGRKVKAEGGKAEGERLETPSCRCGRSRRPGS